MQSFASPPFNDTIHVCWCMRVCACAHICVWYMRVCACVYICIYVYVINLFVCVCACTFPCHNAQLCLVALSRHYICVCVCVYICIYVYAINMFVCLYICRDKYVTALSCRPLTTLYICVCARICVYINMQDKCVLCVFVYVCCNTMQSFASSHFNDTISMCNTCVCVRVCMCVWCMRVCACVYMCIYVYVINMFVCLCVYIYAWYMRVFACEYICIYIYVINICVCVCVCVCVKIRVIHACVCVQIYMYMRICNQYVCVCVCVCVYVARHMSHYTAQLCLVALKRHYIYGWYMHICVCVCVCVCVCRKTYVALHCTTLPRRPCTIIPHALSMDMQSARIAGFHGNSISCPSSGGSRQIYTINPILIQ